MGNNHVEHYHNYPVYHYRRTFPNMAKKENLKRDFGKCLTFMEVRTPLISLTNTYSSYTPRKLGGPYVWALLNSRSEIISTFSRNPIHNGHR